MSVQGQEYVKSLEELKLGGLSGEDLPRRAGESGYHGRLFESSFGVQENNRTGMDLAECELKAKKHGSRSRITLFSKEPEYLLPEIPNIWPLVERYGILAKEEGKTRFNLALKFGKTLRGFCLDTDDEYLYIVHEKLGRISRWSWETLCSRAQEKLQALCVGFIDHDYSLKRATEYRSFEKTKFMQMIKSGDIYVETRARIAENIKPKRKNRGTCFRICERKVKQMYKNTLER